MKPVLTQPHHVVGGPFPVSGEVMPSDVSYRRLEGSQISHKLAVWYPAAQAVRTPSPWCSVVVT